MLHLAFTVAIVILLVPVILCGLQLVLAIVIAIVIAPFQTLARDIRNFIIYNRSK